MLQVKQTRHDRLKEEALLARFFAEEQVTRQYEVRFVTPTTHKSEGVYLPFPSPAIMYRNLALRFSAFSDQYRFDDMQTIRTLAEHTNILRYSLRSNEYALKGIKISSYTGFLVLEIRGPDMLAGLAGVLLSAAEYLGIGIKTAMGMGGSRVSPIVPHPHGKSDKNGLDALVMDS
jgi:CRISPR-associated endoribonuclease Cas6